jgi:LCP family protein required for cell wall assembly
VPTGWGDTGERRVRGSQPKGPSERPLPKAPRQYYVPASTDAGTGTSAPPRHTTDPQVAPSPAPAPATPDVVPTRRRRGGRRRPARIALALVGVAVALVFAFVVFGLVQWVRMDRVAVASVLSPASGTGTNYLIVGSDSREGFDPSDPNAAAVLGDNTAADTSQRSDTLLVLRVTGEGARMLSLPRDLWVTRADGTQGRINAAYQGGPAALIQTVQGLGVPVHHYVEVDFVTFAGMVDAVGGVTIEIPHPARDDHSGLNLPEAGAVRLDGVQSLAYVRSRRYTELIDGSWRTDPTGDLGRVTRQQQFLRAVMSEAGSTRNPVEVMRISSALSGGLRVDDRMGFFDALAFARRLRGLEPESVELPVFGFRTSGGAAVLGLVQPEADAVLASFR